MPIRSLVFQELKISNSCYMAAAIEFSTPPFIQIGLCFISSRDLFSLILMDMSSLICLFGEYRPLSSRSVECSLDKVSNRGVKALLKIIIVENV